MSHKTESQPATRSSGTPWFALLSVLTALGAAGAALWLTRPIPDRLDRLERELNALQQKAHAPAPKQTKEIQALRTQVQNLETRLANHLKAIAETPPERIAPRPAPAPSAAKTSPPAVSAVRPVASAAGQGAWVVNLTSFSSRAAAGRQLERLKRLGVPAEIVAARVRGKLWHRVRVPGFANRTAAERARQELARQLKIGDTWVGRR